jgi:hypothetical protein
MVSKVKNKSNIWEVWLETSSKDNNKAKELFINSSATAKY